MAEAFSPKSNQCAFLGLRMNLRKYEMNIYTHAPICDIFEFISYI